MALDKNIMISTYHCPGIHACLVAVYTVFISMLLIWGMFWRSVWNKKIPLGWKWSDIGWKQRQKRLFNNSGSNSSCFNLFVKTHPQHFWSTAKTFNENLSMWRSSRCSHKLVQPNYLKAHASNPAAEKDSIHLFGNGLCTIQQSCCCYNTKEELRVWSTSGVAWIFYQQWSDPLWLPDSEPEVAQEAKWQLWMRPLFYREDQRDHVRSWVWAVLVISEGEKVTAISVLSVLLVQRLDLALGLPLNCAGII